MSLGPALTPSVDMPAPHLPPLLQYSTGALWGLWAKVLLTWLTLSHSPITVLHWGTVSSGPPVMLVAAQQGGLNCPTYIRGRKRTLEFKDKLKIIILNFVSIVLKLSFCLDF